MKRTATIVGVALLILAAAGVLAASGGELYEVEAKGRHLRPYPTDTVEKARVLDSFTVYRDAEPPGGTDLLVGLILASISAAALVSGLVLRAAEPREASRLVRFHLVTWMGAGLLAVDELFGIHETIGHNLGFLADLSPVTRPDDLVFGAFLVPVLIYLLYFREVILSSRRALVLWALAFVLLLLAIVLDFRQGAIEEWVEVLSAVCVLAGFADVAFKDLTAAVGAAGRSSQAPAGRPGL
jgi:hypothetical protein